MTITTLHDIERDRFGRPMVKSPNGPKNVPYTRCTTYVSCLEDTFSLSRWQMRMVALGLSERPDLMLQIASVDKDDKKILNDICEKAQEHAKAHAAATIGTALHALTERIDRGQELGVIPAEYQADIDAYIEATKNLTAIHIEQFCVLDNLRIGGTPDRVVELDGSLYIADLKTGSIDYGMGKIAMQLAVYAHSKGYDQTKRERFDLGDVNRDTAIVIHLPAGTGTCELVEVDIKAGWQAVGLATQVREWRKRKNLSWPHNSPGGEAILPYISSLIVAAKTPDDVRALWADHQDVWTDDLTDLAKKRTAELQAG